tara:strand:+ start:12386 stop:13354 length:969 start_codon:yes stop_codon:yes gene_type:complete
MALPSGATFTTAKVTNAWTEYPLRNLGDAATKIYHHTMQVAVLSYAPLDDDDVMTDAGEKPSGSPFGDDAGAFYIGDSIPRPIDGGRVEFVRSFANIPANRTDPNGLYVFNLFTGTAEFSFEKTGSPPFTVTGSQGSWGVTFSLTEEESENFSVGDTIAIIYTMWYIEGFRYTDLAGDVDEVKFLQFTVDSKVGSNFTCSLIYPDGFTTLTKDPDLNAWKIVNIYQPARPESSTVNSPSFLNYRYVKTSDPSTIVLAKKFEPVDLEGVPTSVITQSTTSPSQSAYMAIIDNAEIIAAEDEAVNPLPWRGNIYEVSQIMVKAV